MAYSLFYNYKAIGDVLIVVINPFLDMNRYVKDKEVVALYHNDEIIGYNIFDISNIIKIHYQGLIVNPIDPLINVVNNILKNHHFPILKEELESNFIIGEVCEFKNNIYKIDIKEKIIEVKLDNVGLNILDKVVVIKPNTMLPNAKIASKYTLASKAMLMLDETDDILTLDDGIIGSDFYKGDVKWNN